VPADDALKTIERLMIRVFAGSDVGQQTSSGDALVDDGHGHGSGSDMVMTLLTGILETHMLPDEQTGRLVIELLLHVLGKLCTGDAAAGAKPLGFGQGVFQAAPRQIFGQRLAAMSLAFGLYRLVRLVLGGWLGTLVCGRGGVGSQFGEEPGLIGIEALGLGTIEPPQQQIETMLQPFAFVLLFLESAQQFDDHALEDGGIVGQRRRLGC
jgi:hypothetical protein